MKKIIALLMATICVLTLLCSCKAQKTELIDDTSKETFGNTTSTENDGQASDKQEEQNTEQDGEDGGEDTPDTPKSEYVQPTTFAKAYSNVSTLRNAFYDILSSSLTAVGESSQVLIDTYEVVSGEASFVTISACGSGSDDILKTALSASGYKDVSIAKNESGAYNISVKVSAADPTSEEEVLTDGSFYAHYDTENDSFLCEYTVEGAGTEKLSARRIDGGYLAQYLAPDGKYMRFILMDDYTGKAIIYERPDWKTVLPSDKDGFDADGYLTFYELTDTKFHAIHHGVEYTYHKVLPEGLKEEK